MESSTGEDEKRGKTHRPVSNLVTKHKESKEYKRVENTITGFLVEFRSGLKNPAQLNSSPWP